MNIITKTIVNILVCFFLILHTLNAQEIISPDNNIKVILSMKKTSDNQSFGQVNFKVLYKRNSEYVEVLPNSPLGIIRKDQQFVDNLSLVKESKAIAIHDKYEMICGKRKLCENFGTEKAFSYRNSNNQPLNIVFIVYNNGVAFRYIFPNRSDSAVNIIS
jgi:hypothetical protein